MTWVLGSGAFGTALAISLAQKGPVTLWARDKAHCKETARLQENRKRLPGFTLPDHIRLTSDLSELPAQEICLLCVPTQKLRSLLVSHIEILSGCTLVACCKGIELATGLSPTRVIRDLIPEAETAILTGPSFADDIARGLPTALTLACKDPELGKALQIDLTTPNLRLYRTTDVVGAELGGALKNVMAIACGAAMGANLGESARAALMTRGFAEMQRIAQAMGALPETLAGLSGFGDLTLTCSSEQSRNYRFGLSLGRSEPFDPGVTVEGVATAHATLELTRQHQIDAPIIETVVALSTGKLHVTEAMDMLIKRPLKEE